jgi:hypothetical protein
MLKWILAVFAIFIVLAGMACGNRNVSNSSSIKNKAVGTRVALLESCPGEQRSGRGLPALGIAVATAVAPKLIDYGIAWLHETIQKEAKRFDAMVESNTASLFYCLAAGEYTPCYECIGVARGVLATSDEAPSPQTIYGKLGFAQEPDFFMASRLTYKGENGDLYVRASPVIQDYRRPLSKHGQCKDLVITYTFQFPSAKTESRDGVSATMILPTLELCAGTKLSKPALASLSSPWIRVPGPGEAPEEADEGGKPTAVPFNLMVTLTETDRGRGAELTLHLSKALEESAEGIGKALTEEVQKTLVNQKNK